MTAPASSPGASRAAPLVLALLLLAAAAFGAAADRLWLARQGRLLPSGFLAPPVGGLGPAEERQLREELRRQLRITPEQGPAFDRVVTRQIAALIALRASVRPRLDSIFDDARRALDSVLTPAQRARRDSLLREAAPYIDSVGLRPPAGR